MDNGEVPVGLSMALAQDMDALHAFAALDDAARARLMEQGRRAHSKEEMQRLVNSLKLP
ncbi:MAG: hypothetical protein PHY12_03050 [Eubacteriales bacterium]|nr:hypothetical protein [Eubacteriales bacterium]